MRSSSPNPHAHFFSSIKQVEKRLKLENNTSTSPSINPTSQTNSQSLGSPLYIHLDQSTSNTLTFQESEAPREFLTKSLDFPETQKNQESIFKENPERFNPFKTGGVDDIENLMQLLGFENDDQECVGLDLNSVCDDGFYGNVVKVKGPKCKKEVERLKGWIKYYMDCGEKNEPFILGHLLLAKAALISDGVEGFEFPSTVDEFLRNDPPQN